MKSASALLACCGFALLGGCTSPIILKYEPKAAPAPLSEANQPRIYLASIEDHGGNVRFYGPVGGGVKGSLKEAVQQALSSEFSRLGIPFTASSGDADARLSVEIAEVNIGCAFPAICTGFFKLGLSFQGRDRSVSWKGEIVGTGRAQGPGAGAVNGDAPNRALNLALENVMGKVGPLFESEGLSSLLAASGRGASMEPVAIKSDLDELPEARSPRAAHALVIGVERHRESLPAADFAAGDARLAAEYFKRVLGVPEENVALLLDGRATKSDFEKYFERWLSDRVKPGDEVFVYYSGHGAPNPKTGGAYLVPYDADPTYIDQTGYSVSRMYERLSGLSAKKIVVAVDSCFSGVGGRSVIAKGARPLVSVRTADVPAKITVISASAGDQISNSYQEKGHGLFTYYFLKGLKEKGSDLRAVYDYLKPEVARVARRELNADQDPQWREGK